MLVKRNKDFKNKPISISLSDNDSNCNFDEDLRQEDDLICK
jgi:hypothetical protein